MSENTIRTTDKRFIDDSSQATEQCPRITWKWIKIFCILSRCCTVADLVSRFYRAVVDGGERRRRERRAVSLPGRRYYNSGNNQVIQLAVNAIERYRLTIWLQFFIPIFLFFFLLLFFRAITRGEIPKNLRANPVPFQVQEPRHSIPYNLRFSSKPVKFFTAQNNPQQTTGLSILNDNPEERLMVRLHLLTKPRFIDNILKTPPLKHIGEGPAQVVWGGGGGR